MIVPLEIERILRSNGVLLDDAKRDQLVLFVSLLMEWNRRINLVSRRDAQNIWQSHIVHSISPLFLFNIPPGESLLDLGTGGGLPGIPLAIVHGHLRVTLLDSVQKKTRALQEILSRLNLPHVEVLTGRAEELGRQKSLGGSFDAVIARAVAPLPDLVKWSRPFLCRRSRPPLVLKQSAGSVKSEFSFPYLLALKGGDLRKELRDASLRERGVTITEIALAFPGSELLELVDKKIVVVEYPAAAGVA